MHLDPHQKPPEPLRLLFKSFQKASIDDLERNTSLLDFARHDAANLKRCTRPVQWQMKKHIRQAFESYIGRLCHVPYPQPQSDPADDDQVVAYELNDLPGLFILPSLIPIEAQAEMLDRSLHRDLAVDAHQTNVHFHHQLTYPSNGKSFFDYDPADFGKITPKDPTAHKPMSIRQFLNKKLRWITLGGQYDWSAKKYPDQHPPPFPGDLVDLLSSIFPATKAEAAIVNLYSPGDVLSLHRDVAEFCDHGLISLSIGCDAIFLLSPSAPSADEPQTPVAVRLRSGDVVYMTGESRYAWHGVPQIIRNTCPLELQRWPARSESLSGSKSDYANNWPEWLMSKRININVRQMYG